MLCTYSASQSRLVTFQALDCHTKLVATMWDCMGLVFGMHEGRNDCGTSSIWFRGEGNFPWKRWHLKRTQLFKEVCEVLLRVFLCVCVLFFFFPLYSPWLSPTFRLCAPASWSIHYVSQTPHFFPSRSLHKQSLAWNFSVLAHYYF